MEGWAWRFLASERPIPVRTVAELVAAIPRGAIRDMMEWGPAQTPIEQVGLLLAHELPLAPMIALSPATPALQDDRPSTNIFCCGRPSTS